MTELRPFQDYPEDVQLKMRQELPAVGRYSYLLTRPQTTAQDQLRGQRHRAWLACAAATFTQSAPTQQVCRYWSIAMDQLLSCAWSQSGLDRYPMALAALGKLGAHELNLSSDVDVVLIRADQAEIPMGRVQQFQKLLTENSPLGFCTRVDLDLRPGGRLGPILPSISQFIDYYGNHGETWERLAFTRFRPVCGAQEIFTEIKDFIAKFSYRRHLDYTLFEDLKLLRSRIHQQYHQPAGHKFNLKLGVGGIRDIELFVHALLIIHGGKRPGLRTANTQEAIEKLKAEGLLPEQEAAFLSRTYWQYRNLENFVQIIEDQQTHTLDSTCHRDLLGELYPPNISTLSQSVDQIVSTLMGDVPESPLTLPAREEEQKLWLKSLKYSEHSIEEVWPKLRNATALSRRTEQDEYQRQVFLRNFVETLGETSLDRDLGLSILTDFVRSTRAKATFFTLLNNHPALVQNLSWLFSASPYLGTILTSRPELIDGFILHSQLPPNPELDVLLQQLSDRRLLNEIISSSSFLANRNVLLLLESLSDVADSICTDLLEHVKTHLQAESLTLLCLGKWGGRELGLRSDLDFVFVSADPHNERCAKAAKRFISLISAKNLGGSLYAVDLRLRPSGSAGPIMISYSQVQEYLVKQAEAWERQAYLRARSLGEDLPHDFFAFVNRGLSESDYQKLRDIRTQLKRTSWSPLDIKQAPGGLVDIEFAAQTALLEKKLTPKGPATLAHLQTLAEASTEWQQFVVELSEAYLWFRSLEQSYQLLSLTPGSALDRDQDSFRRLSRLFSLSEEELNHAVLEKLGLCQEILNSLDPIHLKP